MAAAGLSLIASGAAAQETGPLTIDRVAHDLALNSQTFYFNRGTNTVIREDCATDKNDMNVIQCRVDARTLPGFLTLTHADTYRVRDGKLSVTSSPVKAASWGAYDKEIWTSYRDRAIEMQGAQNNMIDLAKGQASVMLSSVVSVNPQRSFNLTLSFHAAAQEVIFSNATHIRLDGAIVSGAAQQAQRGMTAGDDRYYQNLNKLSPGLHQRQ